MSTIFWDFVLIAGQITRRLMSTILGDLVLVGVAVDIPAKSLMQLRHFRQVKAPLLGRTWLRIGLNCTAWFKSRGPGGRSWSPPKGVRSHIGFLFSTGVGSSRRPSKKGSSRRALSGRACLAGAPCPRIRRDGWPSEESAPQALTASFRARAASTDVADSPGPIA